MEAFWKEKGFVRLEKVDKGWSKDQKFCAVKADGSKSLIRISPMAQYEGKKAEFEMMRRADAAGVNMCRAIELGTCPEGVYSIQSWIEGRELEEVLPLLSEAQRYAYGMEAGRILRNIHSLPILVQLEPWESRFNRKMDHKIRGYEECPVKFEGDREMIAYIQANRHLLKDRPQCWQHGDYHSGNMMVDTAGGLVIIDFNRSDYGDPWEEFNRIVWCAQASPVFASGMVNGYFSSQVPEEFWRLLALYISSNTLSAVVWALPFGQEQVDVMLRQTADIMEWYDHMQRVIPSWYCGIRQWFPES